MGQSINIYYAKEGYEHNEAALELQRAFRVAFQGSELPTVAAGSDAFEIEDVRLSIFVSSATDILHSDCKYVVESVSGASTSVEAYAIGISRTGGAVCVHGASPRAAVHAAFALSERLGIRFATEGMYAIPLASRRMSVRRAVLAAGIGEDPLLASSLGPTGAAGLLGLQPGEILVDEPIFDVRGLQPFHDFASGPDWWPRDEWARVEEGIAQRRGNTIAVHTYPINDIFAEPAVWVGLREQVGQSGSEVSWAYNASWHSTMKGGWNYGIMSTADYQLGAQVLFDADCFQNRDIDQDLCPWGSTQAAYQRQFQQSGELLDYAFSFGDSVGVNSVIGTEAPLVTPPQPMQPLTLYYSESRQDSFVTATSCAECEGLYEPVGIVGWVSTQPTADATVALKTYYNGGIGDNILLPEGVQAPAGYTLVRTEGYAFAGASSWQYDDEHVQLLMYGKGSGKGTDHRAVTQGTASQSNATAQGYALDPSLTGHAWVLAPSAGPGVPSRQDWYEGILARALQAYPSLDTYWVWTPEGWEWSKVNVSNPLVQETLEDLRALEAAKHALGPIAANLSLATCGWVLGPLGNRSLLDYELSPEWTLSSLDQLVGYKYVDPAYQNVTRHRKWVIPWAEDDPRLTAPELWVWRTLSHADDAQKYGAQGFTNIHWRTRAVGPTLEATAQRSWRSGQNLTAGQFWNQWATASFGPSVGVQAAPIFEAVDSFSMPRPVSWVGGPGGLISDGSQCQLKETNYTFVDELCSLRPGLARTALAGGDLAARWGDAQALERFDYWCDSFQYARQLSRTDCALYTWQSHVLPQIKAAKDPAEKVQLARSIGYQALGDLVSNASQASMLQLQTVSSHGERGISSNLQSHSFQRLVYEQVPVLAQLANLTSPKQLPARCQPSPRFLGRPSLRVMSPRGRLQAGDDLRVEAVVVSDASVLPQEGGVVLHWRALGSKGAFASVALKQSMEGRGVFLGNVDAGSIGGKSLEYYVEAQLGNGADGASLHGVQGAGSSLVFPPGAPGALHTVVVV